MSPRPAVLGALLLALLGALSLGVVSRDGSDSRRVVVAAVESDEAAAVCAASNVKPEDFWARAKAMGVGAAIVRPQPLADAVKRGEILHFTREEIERWKAVGLLPPSAPLRPNSFWTKDARLYDELLQAMTSQGVAPTTGTLGGFRFIEVPEGREVALQGYDPQRVAALGGLPALYAGAAPAPPATLGLDDASWTVGGSSALLLRRALSDPRRLLIVHLDAGIGADANLDAVRAALREIAARGAALGALPPAQAPASSSGALAWLGVAAAWLLGIFGPLLAARGGLVLLRRLRLVAVERQPALSPVLQIAGGLAGTAAFAAWAGALAHAVASARLPLSVSWSAAALVGPAAVALLTLYTIDLEAWGKALRKPATYAALLQALLAALAVCALLAPRWTLQAAGLGALQALSPRMSEAWWWPWRWRETLVGFPCLMQAMFLVNWRLDCPDCSSLPARPLNDPRGWFLLGLLAPIGIVQAVGRGGVPELLAFEHTLATLAIGAGIGALTIAWRLRHTHAHFHSASPAGEMHAGSHSHSHSHSH